MDYELSAIYNKSLIYRGGDYKKYSYANIYVIKNENDKSVELEAKKHAEIKQAISDSIRYLNNYGIEGLPLMFNGIKILVHVNSDERLLMKQYFEDFEEFRKKVSGRMI